MAVKICVTPEALRSKAHEIDRCVGIVEKQWHVFENNVIRSKSYWEGDAGKEHQRYYHEVKDEVDMVIRMLKEYPIKLQKIAGVYSETEAEIQELENELPTDVIL